MSLGSGVITLRDLTNAYAIIANGGKKIESKFITSIYNRNGNKIRDTSLKKCKEYYFEQNGIDNKTCLIVKNCNDSAVIISYNISEN